jgi:hypothetical protein
VKQPILIHDVKDMNALKNYLNTRDRSTYQQMFLNNHGEPLSERGVRKPSPST